MKLHCATDLIALTPEEKKVINNKKSHYKDAHAVVIEVLKLVQKKRGWISDEVIIEISHILSIPVSDIEEVATFYSQIFRKKVGRHIIRYCDSVVCYITGYQNILTALEQSLYIKACETTQDGKFTLLPTCCLGNCDKSPTIMIDNDTYTHLKPEHIPLLLKRYQ